MSRRSEEELHQLATRVAIEATSRERARCVWILDRLLQGAQVKVAQKLMTATETQVAEVRLQLTKTIVTAAKGLILSDARPPVATLTPVQQGGSVPPVPPTPEPHGGPEQSKVES